MSASCRASGNPGLAYRGLAFSASRDLLLVSTQSIMPVVAVSVTAFDGAKRWIVVHDRYSRVLVVLRLSVGQR
jgi:hypothetical protein